MIAPNISDEFLIKKLKEGDKEAFEIIYDKYYLTAYKIFMKNFYNVQMAEDATHDVFVKLRDRVKTFNDIRCFKAWFLVVVKRYACDVLRFNKKHKDNKSLNIFCGKNGSGCFLSNSSYEVDYLELESKKELIVKIKEAFSKVPYAHQEILNLYYLQDLPLRTISENLKIPLGTVKSRVARALEHFENACLSTKGILECL